MDERRSASKERKSADARDPTEELQQEMKAKKPDVYKEPTPMPASLDINSPVHNPEGERQDRYANQRRAPSPGYASYRPYARSNSPFQRNSSPGFGNRVYSSRPYYSQPSSREASPTRAEGDEEGRNQLGERRRRPGETRQPIVGLNTPPDFNLAKPEMRCHKCGGPSENGVIDFEIGHHDGNCRLYLHYNKHRCRVCAAIGFASYHYEKYCKRNAAPSSN